MMSLHNQSQNKPALNPSPDTIRRRRLYLGLTKTQAGALVHRNYRAWQRWECGTSKMDPAIWELFNLKANS